jgi:hypothetical protein
VRQRLTFEIAIAVDQISKLTKVPVQVLIQISIFEVCINFSNLKILYNHNIILRFGSKGLCYGTKDVHNTRLSLPPVAYIVATVEIPSVTTGTHHLSHPGFLPINLSADPVAIPV